MDMNLSCLRDTLRDVTELLSLTSAEDATPPSYLMDIKVNLERIIPQKELEDRKQAVLQAVNAALENVSHNANIPNDIFSGLDDEKLPGRRCALPSWTSRGYYIHQNAVVAEVTAALDSSQRSLRVFFVNPTRTSDIPCDAFVTHGTCPKGSLCLFSHGTIVSSEDLVEWSEPDPIRYLQEGQLCLALPEPLGLPDSSSSLWHHARIRHTDIDGGTCVVEWCGHGEGETLASLTFTRIHPICPDNETDATLKTNGSSSAFLITEDFLSSDGDDYLEDEGVANSGVHEVKFHLGEVVNSPSVFTPTLTPTNSEVTSEALGVWELHTRGIGSRLLRQMGYSGVGGLGRYGTGMRLPVATDTRLHQIVLDEFSFSRPSLDRLVEMKAEQVEAGGKRRCRERKKRLAAAGSSSSGTNHHNKSAYFSGSIFDFINTRVLGDATGKGDTRDRKTGIISKTVNKKKKTSSRELNIELYNIQRDIGVLRGEMARTEESLKRNESKGNSERTVAVSARSRLDEQTSQLRVLQQRESRILATRKQHRNAEKLRVF